MNLPLFSVGLEYRLDHVSARVFRDLRDGSAQRSNQVFGTAVVVSF